MMDGNVLAPLVQEFDGDVVTVFPTALFMPTRCPTSHRQGQGRVKGNARRT